MVYSSLSDATHTKKTYKIHRNVRKQQEYKGFSWAFVAEHRKIISVFSTLAVCGESFVQVQLGVARTGWSPDIETHLSLSNV